MADASCQSSQVIIQDYLLKSIKVSGESNSDVHDAYIKLAKFADREYQHVKTLSFFTVLHSEVLFCLGFGLYKIYRLSKDDTKCRKIKAEG